ncbi:hypothetical protein GCM10020260_15760 [Nesterenkonia halobia]|uniref:Uncharacterized protein n=1 Tax=Nesterenkonia halobia TaxID=37922 RepID=A0ABP6RE64_9MICC
MRDVDVVLVPMRPICRMTPDDEARIPLPVDEPAQSCTGLLSRAQVCSGLPGLGSAPDPSPAPRIVGLWDVVGL